MSNAAKANSETAWIKVKDFVETTYWMNVTNGTTKIRVEDQGHQCIELVEFRDAGLVLKLPKNSCSTGHLLMIEISRREKTGKKTGGKLESMSATAKVNEVEKVDDRCSLFTCTFYQYDVKQWQAFLSEYEKRQTQVDHLVKRITE